MFTFNVFAIYFNFKKIAKVARAHLMRVFMVFRNFSTGYARKINCYD